MGVNPYDSDVSASLGYIFGEFKNNTTIINIAENNPKFKSIDGVVYDKDMTEILYCSQGAKSVIIPDGITSIDNSAFRGMKDLTSITIPNSVTNIGDNAFADTGLTDIVIPEGVLNIGEHAFTHTKLSSITIPASVMNIGKDGNGLAFVNCFELTDIIVDENNTKYASIDGILFNKDKTILLLYPEGIHNESYRIPDGVIGFYEGIGNSIINQHFKDIYIPASFKDDVSYFREISSNINIDENNKIYASIDGVLFNKDKTKLIAYPTSHKDNYIIPDGVTSIEDYAFQYCNNLTNITFASTIVDIGNYAFQFCDNLTNITFNSTIVDIGNYAFKNCTSLANVELSGNNIKMGENIFYGCSSLKNISIADGVSNIGIGIFGGANNIESITIPKSVTHIDEDTFENHKNVTIRCYKNSYAASFAQAKKLNYKYIDESSTDKPINSYFGDANGDNIIDVSDASMILQKILDNNYILDIEFKRSDYKKYLDVDCDGTVTANDAAIVLKKALNSDFIMPVEK